VKVLQFLIYHGSVGNSEVKISRHLISHGIIQNSEVPFLSHASEPEYTGIVIFTLLIFHNPVSKRARLAAKGGVTPAKPGSGERSSPPGAERESTFTA
jgi:hypothetical protein